MIDYTTLGYSRETVAVTINVPVSHPIKSYDDGVTVYAPISQLPAHIIERAVTDGLARVLNDGIGAKDLPEEEKIAKQCKRLDAMMAGNWTIQDRETSVAVVMLDLFVADQMKGTKGTEKAVRESLRKMITKALGEKAKLTWTNLAPVIAKAKAKTDKAKRSEAELIAALEEAYEGRARAIINEQAKSASSVELDFDGIDI